MRTFDELLDDLAYRARWERDELESAKQTLRSMRDAAVAAERARWIAACNTVADGAEAAGRPGVQTVAQVRRLAIDGPNAEVTGRP